ncbi:hypothetical protein [Terrisporobacter petrolearius]|uniref:hypothetical protein n=1 Tax=Terrisporobacter petrolearius TaxID=1460447 RepID=UPI003B004A58
MEKAMHSYELINNLVLEVILGTLIIVDLNVIVCETLTFGLDKKFLFFISCNNECISSG